MTVTETPLQRRRLWPLLVAVLPALAVLIVLGTWQMQRLHWKEGLLSDIEARTAMAPIALDGIEARLSRSEPVEYVPVQVSGRFDHANEQFFFATHRGLSGWYVYTPLRLADGRAVFVNRGFVPYAQKDPATRPDSQPAGAVAVTGLARERLAGKPSFIVPDNQPDRNVYHWKDLDAMGRAAGLPSGQVLPFFIDAGRPGEPVDPARLPMPGVTIIDLPNNHLQYAVTWYGLAAALALVSVVFAFRRR